jgi:hypothetical protein
MAAPTSLIRFSVSLVAAALASIVVPFLITPFSIIATGERLAGMGMGVIAGIILGWCLFPVIAWRPFRAAHLLAVFGVSAVAFTALLFLPENWVTTPHDDYGIYAAMISYGLIAIAAYGILTWCRNLLLFRLNGFVRGRDESDN